MTVYKPKTVTATVKKVFEKIAPGSEFSGIDFKRLCVKENPKLKYKYEETFLRLLRMYYRDEFICISRQKSKYRKIGE